MEKLRSEWLVARMGQLIRNLRFVRHQNAGCAITMLINDFSTSSLQAL